MEGCSTTFCEGRANSCFYYYSLNVCLEAGCDWEGDDCVGRPADCAIHDDEYFCQRIGCSWRRSGEECGGSPLACSTLDRDECRAMAGCRVIGEPFDAGPPDAGIDSGVGQSWPDTMCPFGVCDLRSGEGCASDEKCMLSAGAPACLAAGGSGEGLACRRHDDCADGHLCMRLGDDASCRRVCCGGDSSHCEADESCTDVTGFDSLGSCLRQCDLLARDCPEGIGCYRSDGDAICLSAGAAMSGESCSVHSACVPGLACIAFDSGAECVALCDRSVSSSCSGVGVSCQPFADFGPVGYCR